MRKYRMPVLFFLCILVLWEILYRLKLWPELIFPSAGTVLSAWMRMFVYDHVVGMIGYSLKLIGKGLLTGILLAVVCSSMAMVRQGFYQIYHMVVSLCDLIPGVALIPLAILWMGVGEGAVVLIVVHSVIWPMSRNIMDGFQSVPRLYIEVGKSIGLHGFSLVRGVYLPAALPQIISGLRVGWARAWRGLISTEMIFGTTSSGAGIGWYIMMKRTNVDIAGVFAAILAIVMIGCVVEYVLFRTLEKHTVQKWGMSG